MPPVAPPAPVPVELTTDQWADIAFMDDGVLPQSQGLALLPSVHAFAGYPSRLERPPRGLMLAA
jgi:hypothetical protein